MWRTPSKNISAQKGDWLEFSPPLRNFVPVPFLPCPESHPFFIIIVAQPAGKEHSCVRHTYFSKSRATGSCQPSSISGSVSIWSPRRV
jgi:hypothetical protein